MRRLFLIYLSMKFPITIGLILILISMSYGLFLYLSPIIIFSFLDAKSRFNEFIHTKEFIKKGGNPEKLIKIYKNSRCQRDAFISSLIGTDYYSKIKYKFKNMGYSWYHIMPDWFYKNPFYFITTDFWRTFFK